MDSEIYITSEMIPDVSKLLIRAAEISNIRKTLIGTKKKNKRPSAKKKKWFDADCKQLMCDIKNTSILLHSHPFNNRLL